MNRYIVRDEPEVYEEGDFVLWEDYEKLEQRDTNDQAYVLNCEKRIDELQADRAASLSSAIDMVNKIAELEAMLDIACDAVVEAGYQGFSNKLKEYIER